MSGERPGAQKRVRQRKDNGEKSELRSERGREKKEGTGGEDEVNSGLSAILNPLGPRYQKGPKSSRQSTVSVEVTSAMQSRHAVKLSISIRQTG